MNLNTNLVNIIKRIIAEQGEAILANPAQLKGYVADYAAAESKPERLAFGRCIEYGAYTELKNAPDAQARAVVKASVAQKVLGNTGLDISLCNGALDVLEAALFGNASAQSLHRTPQTQQAAYSPSSSQTYLPQSQYRSQPQTQTSSRTETNKAGFMIGVLNLLNVIVVYLTRNSIQLPEEDRTVIIFAWFIVTIVAAITGFCLSISETKKNIPGKGFGIAGMVLNGLVILPALIFCIGAIFNSGGAKKSNKKVYIIK